MQGLLSLRRAEFCLYLYLYLASIALERGAYTRLASLQRNML
jgi:hypothetical protein